MNDTIIGDPLFTVPLYLTLDSHHFDERPSLCFEVHGTAGKFFNLVSDTCTSVNALYQTSTEDAALNYISEIGVKAINLRGECVTISVSVDCVPEIHQGKEIVEMPHYDEAGITVRRFSSFVRISVPNCATSPLVMWIKCWSIDDQPQLRFDITRGLNLNPTSHGLLGELVYWVMEGTAWGYLLLILKNCKTVVKHTFLPSSTPSLSPVFPHSLPFSPLPHVYRSVLEYTNSCHTFPLHWPSEL